jgi:hemoglobin
MSNHDSSEESLFIRLGGREGIGRLVTGLYERLHGDLRINGFWKGHSDDSKARGLQSVIDFVAQGARGPVNYEGRDMRTSHEGLVITSWGWSIFFEHSEAVLAQFEVSENVKHEVLMWFESFKELVINESSDQTSVDDHRRTGGLSGREEEVLKLIVAGKSNPEIAEILFISLNTVNRHVTNIFNKTGTVNRVEAALYADRSGLT